MAKKMTKSQIVAGVAEAAEISKKQAAAALEALADWSRFQKNFANLCSFQAPMA